jgi:hypothetical protein
MLMTSADHLPCSEKEDIDLQLRAVPDIEQRIAELTSL